jgi:hypothetical protein
MGPSRMVPVAPLDWVPRYEKRRRFVAERTFRLSVVWMREPMGNPVGVGGGGVCVREKDAVTDVLALSVTKQEPVPKHAPDQPAKEEPVAGEAVRVTAVPCVRETEHVVPQEIPEGLEVTLPCPSPCFETESV